MPAPVVNDDVVAVPSVDKTVAPPGAGMAVPMVPPRPGVAVPVVPPANSDDKTLPPAPAVRPVVAIFGGAAPKATVGVAVAVLPSLKPKQQILHLSGIRTDFHKGYASKQVGGQAGK